MHLLSQVRLGMDLTKVNLLVFMGMGGGVNPEFCVKERLRNYLTAYLF